VRRGEPHLTSNLSRGSQSTNDFAIAIVAETFAQHFALNSRKH